MACSPPQSASAAAYHPSYRHRGDLSELVVRETIIVSMETNRRFDIQPLARVRLAVALVVG